MRHSWSMSARSRVFSVLVALVALGGVPVGDASAQQQPGSQCRYEIDADLYIECNSLEGRLAEAGVANDCDPADQSLYVRCMRVKASQVEFDAAIAAAERAKKCKAGVASACWAKNDEPDVTLRIKPRLRAKFNPTLCGKGKRPKRYRVWTGKTEVKGSASVKFIFGTTLVKNLTAKKVVVYIWCRSTPRPATG